MFFPFVGGLLVKLHLLEKRSAKILRNHISDSGNNQIIFFIVKKLIIKYNFVLLILVTL